MAVWVTLGMIAAGAGAGLPGQDVVPSDRSLETPVWSSTNLILASLVFAPLMFIDPLEEFDQSLTPATVGAVPPVRRVGRTLGEPLVGLALAGGATLVGSMIDNDDVRQVGIMSLKALVVAEAVTLTLKVAVGRSRPYVASDPGRLHPFAFNRDHFSFPSGHTAHAFSMATVVARHFGADHRWVPYVSYGLATTTAVSRVLERKHWPTDVLAGAAVGILAGRLVGTSGSENDTLVQGVVLGPTPGGGFGISMTLGVN